MAKTKPKTATEGPEICRVFDTNATTGPRTHEIKGKKYALSADGEGTEVPMEHALLFLKDPSFIVMDPKRKRMTLKEPPPELPGVRLPIEQTIATWDELSLDALLVRVRRLPEGKGATKAMGKSAMIELLMESREHRQKPSRPAERDLVAREPADESEEGDGNTALADNILGDKSQYMPPELQDA